MKHAPIMLMVAALATLSPQPFPGGGQGIGFDDLGFAPTLRKVMIPGGSTGKLALIDPDSQKIEIIGGFSERAGYAGGHGEGITSSDACRGRMYVTDRSARLLDIVDPQAKKIIATARLASGPDYVRFVLDTNEVWVTEPGAERIEIFTLPARSNSQWIHRSTRWAGIARDWAQAGVHPSVASYYRCHRSQEPQDRQQVAQWLPRFSWHCARRKAWLPLCWLR
jgi:hypothetical protein